MELILPDGEYGHYSSLASGAVGDGKRIFTLALSRSDRKPEVNARSEMTAQFAAAKICQQQQVRIEKVWFEDGEHPDFGKYRRWYMMVEKAA
jgi:hypothetical protein